MKTNIRLGLRVCPHVHCRGGKWAYKCTIADILELSNLLGFGAIFDMPNQIPLTIDRESVAERLSQVPEDSDVEYYTYVGLTGDENQIEEAVWCWNNLRAVIGLKMFAGRSIGPMAVIEEQFQRLVYQVLARLGYEGMAAVHCEKESLLLPDLWNSKRPSSHFLARPKIAEVESIRDQIKFAKEAGFKGTLHICHVSCAESVQLIKEARWTMKITCGVTPHHSLLSIDVQDSLLSLGNLLKMNPPLRTEEDRLNLMQCLLDGDIDWIESDQARHTMAEKLSEPYLSGVDALYLYGDLVDRLNEDLSADRIDQLTRRNIIDAFSPKVDHLRDW